jgi:hypothetical protein
MFPTPAFSRGFPSLTIYDSRKAKPIYIGSCRPCYHISADIIIFLALQTMCCEAVLRVLGHLSVGRFGRIL